MTKINENINEFIDDIPDSGVIFGIDWGGRDCGLAVSNEEQSFALPFDVYNNIDSDNKTLIEDLVKLFNNKRSVAVVIGYPINSQGKPTEMSKRVKDFASKLGEQITTPILLYDERHTTQLARISLGSSGLSRKNKKKRLDSVASSFILNEVISSISRRRNKDTKVIYE